MHWKKPKSRIKHFALIISVLVLILSAFLFSLGNKVSLFYYSTPKTADSLSSLKQAMTSITYFSLDNLPFSSKNPQETAKKCLSVKNPKSRQICQADHLDQILLTGGITEAFDLIDEYYKKDPLFQKQCHSFTHRIGETGYEYFSQKKEIRLGDNTSHCGYGFYHGFMEALVQKTNDLSLAKQFCKNVAQQVEQTDKKAEGSCYHGIGHGTVDGSDPRDWGDPYKIIEPGLTMCQKVTSHRPFLYQCAGGIFNSLAIMYTNSENGLQRNQDDPFKVCYGFGDYILEACLNQMNTYIISLSNRDLEKAGKYLHKIPVNLGAGNAADAAVSFLAASKQEPSGYKDIIQTCQSFREDLVIPCVNGYAAGLIEFGPPDKEYVASLAFCQHQLLDRSQRHSCFQRALSYIQLIYSSSQVDAVCAKLDAEYRTYCRG